MDSHSFKYFGFGFFDKTGQRREEVKETLRSIDGVGDLLFANKPPYYNGKSRQPGPDDNYLRFLFNEMTEHSKRLNWQQELREDIFRYFY